MKTNTQHGTLLLPALLALGLAAACGGSDPSTPLPDAGVALDATVTVDAGGPTDSGTPADPAIVRFNASSRAVDPGEKVTLDYEVTAAAHVSITAETGGVEAPLLADTSEQSGQVESAALTEATVFHLRATGNGKTVERTETVDVVVPDVQILAFTAPELVDRGATVVAEWAVLGATEVRIYDRGTAIATVTDGSTSGSVEVRVLQGPRTLTIEATNGWRTRSASLVIRTRDPGEILDFHVSPSVIRTTSTPARVSWSVRGETVQILANGAPLPGVAPDVLTSSVTVTLNEPTIFTLIATGLGRTEVTRRAVVPGALMEREPNDETRFSDPGAPGVLGLLDGAGRTDIYQVTVPPGGNVYAELTDRYGRCAFDGGLRLLDAAGVELFEKDNGETEPCARIDPLFDPAAASLGAGTYYVAVDGRDSGAYYGVALIAGDARCGNGIFEPSRGEACDDGNLTPADGCSPGCRLEVLDTVHLPGPPASLSGSLAAPGVVDYYALIIDQPVTLALETGVPTLGVCDDQAGYADTYLQLLDASSQVIAESDDHLGLCAGLVPVSPGLVSPGSYYVAVRAYGAGVIPAYTLGVRAFEEVCGDGVLAPSEACDDGNTRDGDGCSAACAVERLQPPGGALTAQLAPGATRVIEVEVTTPGQSITATTSNGRGGCDVDTRLILVKDGAYLGYTTGGAGCARFSGRTDAFAANLEPGTYRVIVYDEGNTTGTVVLEVGVEDARCGNGIAESRAHEQCDDGNLVDGDGCGADCRRQVYGTAHGPGPTEILTGALVVSGDEQMWGLELSAPANLVAEVGIPVIGSCTGGDPVLELYDVGLQLITQNDDANGLCSRIDAATDPAARLDAGSYILLLRAYDRRSPIPNYQISVTLTAAGCGNGVLEGGEQCDDGNLVAGDGCSEVCAYEGNTLAEIEPNNSSGSALLLPVTRGTTALVQGATNPAGDEDWYSFTIPPGQTASLHAQTRTDRANLLACSGADTWLSLYDGAGTVLVEDDDDGENTCSLIDGTGVAPRDPQAANLASGTYYLKHRAYSPSQQIAVYFLEVSLQ